MFTSVYRKDASEGSSLNFWTGRGQSGRALRWQCFHQNRGVRDFWLSYDIMHGGYGKNLVGFFTFFHKCCLQTGVSREKIHRVLKIAVRFVRVVMLKSQRILKIMRFVVIS